MSLLDLLLEFPSRGLRDKQNSLWLVFIKVLAMDIIFLSKLLGITGTDNIFPGCGILNHCNFDLSLSAFLSVLMKEFVIFRGDPPEFAVVNLP